jgi:hypothetical protein
MTNEIKRYRCFILLGAVAVLAVLVFAWFGRYTVMSGEKQAVNSGNRYGYEVDKYFCWNTTRLRIWRKAYIGYEMDAVYEFPQLTVERIVDEKWFKNDMAIYLNLDVKYHDSLVSVHPVRVIYDFNRGEMHTSSRYTLWRIRNGKDNNDRMTDDEFNSILNRLDDKAPAQSQ